MTPPKTFTCIVCHGTFPDAPGDDEKADAEFKARFGDAKKAAGPVCDGCYAKIIKANES